MLVLTHCLNFRAVKRPVVSALVAALLMERVTGLFSRRLRLLLTFSHENTKHLFHSSPGRAPLHSEQPGAGIDGQRVKSGSALHGAQPPHVVLRWVSISGPKSLVAAYELLPPIEER